MLNDFQKLWLTSRKGTLPKINELKSINVAKTCERLRLAITQSRNGLQRALSHKRCQLEALSFRSISGLCYTTLRVHELQVNDLLNRSEALVAQSRGWTTTQTRKRSHPSTCSATIRTKTKRRRTIEYSAQDITTTNYSQLLDETETFVEWGKIDEFVNKMTKTNGQCRATCVHIREITINEVDMQNERYSMDEDEGFGNATNDEITMLLQLLSDASAADGKEAKTQKRKAIEMASIDEKRAKCIEAHDAPHSVLENSEIEIPRNFEARGKDMVDNFMPAIVNDPSQEYFGEESPGNMQTDALSITDVNIADKTKADSCEGTNNTGCDIPIESDAPFANCHTPKEFPDATNTFNYNQRCVTSSMSINKQKSKSRKIIIDKRIELTEMEMRTQLQTKINYRAKVKNFRAKINWIPKRYLNGGKSYEMILPSANKLLTSLGRRVINFKMKNQIASRNLDNSRISTVYCSLIREILHCEVTDELAAEIYENWKVETQKSINRHQRLPTPLTENIPCLQEDNYNQAFIEPNNGTENVAFNINNNLELPLNTCSPSDDQDEWGAFDVMVKLRNLRFSKNVLGDKIPVEYLLQPAILVRKKAAKGFAALLKLAASRFIVLLPAEKSIQLEYIKMGAASVKLIQKNKANAMSLRRASIGYRKHAN